MVDVLSGASLRAALLLEVCLGTTLSQAAMRRMRPLGVRGAGTPAKWIGWAAAMAKERACSSVTPRVRPAAPAVGEMIFHNVVVADHVNKAVGSSLVFHLGVVLTSSSS